MRVIKDMHSSDNKYQASDAKEMFIFRANYDTGVDTISGFGADDKIRLRDFDGTFEDLTFEVDASANTITIRYDASRNKIVLRDVADLIDGNGNHLLTAANFSLEDAVVSSSGRLKGTDGDDILFATGHYESLTSEYYSVNTTLIGGDGDDVLDGDSGDDLLRGGNGDDYLDGEYGDDILRGGRGDDTLDGGRDDDTLYGGRGDDTLDGSWGDDTLYGGRGDDTLDGSWGDDTLQGSKGDDTLEGSHGADTFVFREGDGHDIITDLGLGWSRREIESVGTWQEMLRAEEKARENGWVDKIQIHLNVAADTTDEAAFQSLTMSVQGEDLVIGYGSAGDTITLKDVRVGEVTIDDFEFVFVG